MSFPVYILDDDTILFTKEDKTHPKFWEETVAPQVAAKFNIPLNEILNIPYCQRRGRVVGDNFYCGEKINRTLLKKIAKAIGQDIQLVFDEHECKLDFDCYLFMAHFRNPDR